MNGKALANPVATMFEQKRIKHLAVVDDAFGPPVREDFGAVLDTFWAAVEDDDDAFAELVTLLGATPSQSGDLTNQVLAKIWEARATLVSLATHYQAHLASAVNGRLTPLNALLTNLRSELGREVSCHSSIATFNDTQARIIFVDYYMGPSGQTSSVNRSKDIVSGITEKYSDGKDIPLLVLMSSTEITSEMVEEFRESTGWLGGMFHFIRKQDFLGPDMLALKLAALVNLVPAGQTINAFVIALSSAIDSVSKEFIKAIRGLSVEDYAYIQVLSLREDGHPLGDYMLWLYSSYFGRLLFGTSEVRVAQKAIDRVTFDALPPSHSVPSPLLAEIYKAALFDESDGSLTHPRQPDPDAGSHQPHLHLGDLFFKGLASDVLMVLNAQCDLAFTPDGTHRPFKPAKSVLLIPGRLQPLDSPLSEFDEAKPRTELFEHEKRSYRIVWDTKRVTSHALGEFASWCGTEGYKPAARLRLPFAFQLQQHFASDLTRVGMPVAPPISRPVTVQLYCATSEGKTEILVDAPRSAFLFLTRHGEQCVMSEELAHDIKAACGKAADFYEKRIEFSTQKGAVAATTDKMRAALKELRTFAAKLDTLFLFRGPFIVPPGRDPIQFANHPIAVSRGAVPGKSFRCDHPVLLNIVPGETFPGSDTQAQK